MLFNLTFSALFQITFWKVRLWKLRNQIILRQCSNQWRFPAHIIVAISERFLIENHETFSVWSVSDLKIFMLYQNWELSQRYHYSWIQNSGKKEEHPLLRFSDSKRLKFRGRGEEGMSEVSPTSIMSNIVSFICFKTQPFFLFLSSFILRIPALIPSISNLCLLQVTLLINCSHHLFHMNPITNQ